jgi:phenylalanyl-tRNA synthetase alpha chain
MEQLLNQIAAYKSEVEATRVTDAKQVEEFRIKWLGTKGIVKAVMGEMKNVAPEQKKEAGQVLNDFKLLWKANLNPSNQQLSSSKTTIQTQ